MPGIQPRTSLERVELDTFSIPEDVLLDREDGLGASSAAHFFCDVRGDDRLKKSWEMVRDLHAPYSTTTKKAREAFHTIALKKTSWVKVITLLCPLILGIAWLIEKVLINRHTDELTKKFSELLDSVENSSQELMNALQSHAEEGEELTQENAIRLRAQLKMDIDNFTKAFDALEMPQDNEYCKELAKLKSELSELSKEIHNQLNELELNLDRRIREELESINKDLPGFASITLNLNGKTYLIASAQDLFRLLCTAGLSDDQIVFVLRNAHQGVLNTAISQIRAKTLREAEVGKKDYIRVRLMDSKHDGTINVTINISEEQIKISTKGQLACIQPAIRGRAVNRIQSQQMLEVSLECSRDDSDFTQLVPEVSRTKMAISSVAQKVYEKDAQL